MKKREININFSEICREVRMKTGMSEKDMATHLKITVPNYRKYETGQINPGPEAAFRLAGLYLAFCQINISKNNLLHQKK